MCEQVYVSQEKYVMGLQAERLQMVKIWFVLIPPKSYSSTPEIYESTLLTSKILDIMDRSFFNF